MRDEIAVRFSRGKKHRKKYNLYNIYSWYNEKQNVYESLLFRVLVNRNLKIS